MSISSIFKQFCTTIACITFAGGMNSAFAVTMAEGPLEREINSALNVTHSWNTTLRINPTPGRTIRISIPIENVTYTLELESHSVRADGYQLLMQNADGGLDEVPAGPIRTMRGSILELDGSIAGGSLMENGLYVRIRLANGEDIWMEPVGDKLERAQANLYALYRASDVIPSGGTCAAEAHMNVSRLLQMQREYVTYSNERGTIICTAQLACDADYEFYQDWDTQTESRINSVINSLNIQYEDEVNLLHEITTVIIRSDVNDPYTTTNAGSLLEQFGNYWNSNHSTIQRDVAHLFTGKSLQGGTIGIAWLGVVGFTNSAYSLVESDCCNNYSCTTDLSAHELGHNWNADHVNTQNYTMYPSIMCANRFHSQSISSINSYANQIVNYLSCANQAQTGACCVSTTNCIELYQDSCSNLGGEWHGETTPCASVQCGDPEGACCTNESCAILTEIDCTSGVGTYYGDNTDCATVSCVTGACCLGASCSITLQDDCTGSWYGENTNCVDVTCGSGADQLNYQLRTWSRSDGQSMETYDLYFPSTDPNTKVTSVFGEGADFMRIRGLSNAEFDDTATAVELHQETIFGAVYDFPHNRGADSQFGNDLVFDSYVTVGSEDSQDGVPDNIGFDSAGFNSAIGLYMTNGAIYVTPDNALASMGAGTTDGHRVMSVSVESGQGLEVMTNIQWVDGADVFHEARNVYWNNYGLGGQDTCPTDIDGNGSIDVSDLLALIGQWGSCSGCASDFDNSGNVDVTDLLTLISAWGPCE